MQKRRFVPGPAMVVSLIALFVALGGTSYAALTIPRNSVGAVQLKDNAVTRWKIHDGAITAAKIDPSLFHTTGVVGEVGGPQYQGTWEPGIASGDQGVWFYKDPYGTLHLQGSAKTSVPGATGTIFTLPSGYRPLGNLHFSVYGSSVSSPAYIKITSGGDVDVLTAQDYVDLSSITFRVPRFVG